MIGKEREKMASNKNIRSGLKNSVPKNVFVSNKKSRICSVTLVVLIDLITIYYGIVNWCNISEEILIETINIGFCVVLAIVALAITVFQSDKELLKDRNSEENIKKVYLSYIFSIFPIILVLILGYLVALVFKNEPCIISLYFIGTVLVLIKCITGTMASFVAFLNIRD